MAQSVFGSGGNFQRLVQSVLPLVVKQLQESGAPAPSVLPLSTAFENPLMGASLSSSQADFGVREGEGAFDRARRQKQEAKSMLEAMRQQLANLDLTCNNPELLKSFISPDPAMNDCESGDEDSFVDECTEQEKPSRSMNDVLHEMGNSTFSQRSCLISHTP